MELVAGPAGRSISALALAVAIAAGADMSAHAQTAQALPPAPQLPGDPPDPFRTPIPVDPAPQTLVRPPPPNQPPAPLPPTLRGGQDGSQQRMPQLPGMPPPAERRTEGTFVRPQIPQPRARVQRPVQGRVQGEVRRRVTGGVRREVAPAAVTGREQQNVTPPPAAAPLPTARQQQDARERRRRAEEEAFAPLGVRIGSFVLRPSIEAGVGWTDNVNGSSTNRQRTAYSRVATEFQLNSDWRVHALGLRLRAERQDFAAGGIPERVTVDTGLNLRLDVSRDTQIELGAAYRQAPDSATNIFPTPATAVGRPILETYTATGGINQRFGPWAFRLRGQYDELRYGATRFSDGSTQPNTIRDVDVTTVTLRGGYEVAQGIQPFVEFQHNIRHYRIALDTAGLRQGSAGEVYRAGASFDLGPKLRGEIAIGYLIQRPDEPTSARVTGLAFDGSLEWSVSPLTTLRALLRTGVLDSSIPGSGGIQRDLTVSLEHALRRNVIVSASLGYGLDDFAGITRTDQRLTATLAAIWRINRHTQFRVQGSHQRTESTAPGIPQQTNTIEGVLRFEY